MPSGTEGQVASQGHVSVSREQGLRAADTTRQLAMLGLLGLLLSILLGASSPARLLMLAVQGALLLCAMAPHGHGAEPTPDPEQARRRVRAPPLLRARAPRASWPARARPPLHPFFATIDCSS